MKDLQENEKLWIETILKSSTYEKSLSGIFDMDYIAEDEILMNIADISNPL